MDIPPYDTRMDFGISQQLKVQNILIPIDGLDAAVYRAIIRKVSEYLCINDLAMVHILQEMHSGGMKIISVKSLPVF